jgi:hypothetical protein
VCTRDYARTERAHEHYADLLDACAACRSTDATFVDRSRRLPAMLTRTFPDDWLTVAPDGETVKRHFTALAKRSKRAWGESLMCVWKLEFQTRGVRHFHLSATPADGLHSSAEMTSTPPSAARFEFDRDDSLPTTLPEAAGLAAAP